ncbi:MAG: DUF4405 domain-containing protein [Anaerolineae bacterium]
MLSIPKIGLKINKNKLNLFLDLGLLLVFVAEQEMHFTGEHNHELLGVLLGAALIVHIILHWQWVVSITRTFFKKIIHESRFNYLLNLALFVDLFVTIITGIVISRTLGLKLGIDTHAGFPWEQIHILAANLSLLIVALHVAMHWKWIAAHTGKLLPRFRLPGTLRPQPVMNFEQPQHTS